ncbi:hypothetical protein TraAM80_09766 [Trypanosoma rangeli]|uniref:Uncharacterized protein n=1 Tax=Trypanosoma rangeli TaxID=5698 RepID=A0A3R7LZA6_TRYRA|nr:uncharacterized protein TraAM80_09766 [Trypanosoma rangeli]RNE96484.1 hypothetical protein TraAM80_09766 [Trypanosoma rangeli]|eukprot:RNE96484.1 hypothetical protein TraAM80_09766 [Trypanosoma rangeli]
MTKSWVDVFVARGNGQIAQTGLNLLTFLRRLRATVVTASASLPRRRTWAAVADCAAEGRCHRGVLRSRRLARRRAVRCDESGRVLRSLFFRCFIPSCCGWRAPWHFGRLQVTALQLGGRENWPESRHQGMLAASSAPAAGDTPAEEDAVSIG